jgi:pyruvate/2-oxoglutarate dehydrogenase complex dihydrolipoamide acyltransferase (E2) component
MPQTAPATMEATGYPVTPDGEPLKTVTTGDGDYTEAEWSQRQRRDNIVTEDGQQFFEGVGVEGSAEHRSALDDAKQRIAELEQQFENERTIDPFAGEKTKQVVFTTSERIDSPGIGAGGTIVVPEAESGHADTSSRIAAQSSASENERVLEAQRRADAEVKISPARSPTLEAQSEAEQARLDAIVGARDQQPPAERRSDEGAAEQADAAEQAAEDEQEPSATGAARELADELGVDLSEVEGTGTGGKITKADVESAADDG